MKKNALKTEWDMKLFYASEKDPKIEKDTADIGKLCAAFEKKYKGKTDWLEDDAKLLKALKDYESLIEKTSDPKPLYYFFYRQELNSGDTIAEAQSNKLSQEFTKHGNRIIFFTLDLGKMPAKRQKEVLANGTLKHYRYFLKTLFDASAHLLTEPEEKILNLKSLTSRSMWINASQKLENKQTIQFDGKEIPLSEASNLVHSLPTLKRRKLHNLLVARLREISDMAEAEINAVYTDKKIGDELRSYKEPYSATILGYENDETTVLNLVDTVTRGFRISERFYKLKAKILKLPQLEYSDRTAKIGTTTKKISFEEAYQTLVDIFGRTDAEFGEILERMARNGQIDVFPKKGKSGGAFCSSSMGMPTLVLLNHIPDFKSLMTFAHEMGHAIHSEKSKVQPALYQGYTMSAAEVASTLFESVVFDDVFEKLSDTDKIVALHDRINDDIQTIFRQIACFNFELDLHRAIREKGSLPKEKIAVLMNKHMSAYLGKAVKMQENDGYFFVIWSHIRNFFYVYSYAYGQIISKALYAKYKKNPSYISEIKKFLSAGGSMSPEDIFASIGIDTRDPKFFEEGLKQIEGDIERLEKLTKAK